MIVSTYLLNIYLRKSVELMYSEVVYINKYMYHTCGKDQSTAPWCITDIALQSMVYCDIPRLAVVVSIYVVTSHIPRNLIPKP